jgi:hypothetical protein
MRMWRIGAGLGVGVLLLGCGADAGRSSLSPPTPTSTPSRNGYVEPAAVLSETYAVSPDGRSLIVGVAVGGGCLETGTAAVHAEEASTQVVLTASVRRQKAAPSPSQACTADLIAQSVSVPLTEPLDDRRVVDAYSGKELQRPR